MRLAVVVKVGVIIPGMLGFDANDCVNCDDVEGKDELPSRVLKKMEVAVILVSAPVCATNEIAVSIVVVAAAATGCPAVEPDVTRLV